MTTSGRWDQRIAAAADQPTRHELVVEVELARARNLGDVPFARETTFAIARLRHLLGEHEVAVREAKSLLSLCQTPPLPPRAFTAAATALLQSMGQKAPAWSKPGRRERPERPSRKERPQRAERTKSSRNSDRGTHPLDAARAHYTAGRLDAAHKALSGRSPTSQLFRTLIALKGGQKANLEAVVQAQIDDLERSLKVGSKREPKPKVDTPDNTRLAKILGHAVPKRRQSRVQALESFAAAHPERIDELAAAALEHHVEVSGLESAAPWLAGTVAAALSSTEGEATKAMLADLQAKGSKAVAAYDEWPFARIGRLIRNAEGWELQGVRRGVLARSEPEERKLWTLRIAKDGLQRMLVVGPHSTEPAPEGLSASLAERIVKLCPRAVLLATGSGHAELRDLAVAQGITVRGDDADDAQLLADLEAQTTPDAEPTRTKPAPAKPAEKPAGPTPPEVLKAAIEAGLTEESARAAFEGYRRPWTALRIAEKHELSEDANRALLIALHEATDPDRGLAEGTSYLIRCIANGQNGLQSLLTDERVPRYGGPGIEQVAEAGTAVVSAGYSIHRVLQGPTRKESDAHPILDTVAGSMQGLWRLLVRKDDTRGEVWVIASLPAEGRAGVPQLLLQPYPRAVVLPIDAELMGWYGSLDAPEAIGWAGIDSAPALVEAMGAWETSAS